MIITTIQDVPGMEIVEYRGLVTGEVVAGINAVIGVRIDFDALGSDGNNMLLVTVTGTAVVVK